MRKLFELASNPDIDLNTRYELARVMLQLRQLDPVDHEKLKKKRDYQAEYKRRKQIWGV